MTVGEAGEEAIIQQVASRFPHLPSAAVVLGIGDDGALLHPAAGLLQVVTSDLLLAGTHFQLEWTPPDLLGRKALAVNLSDVEAMGASPVAFFLDLGLPPAWPMEAFCRFLDGLQEEARAAGGLPLAGGDTCRARDLHIGLTVVGQVEAQQVIRRSGGRAGDIVAVTGPLGAAAAGLHLLRRGWRLQDGRAQAPRADRARLDAEPAAHALLAQLAPSVAPGRGRSLGGRVSAGMDLSDGLAADLPRLCQASGCGARVDEQAIPVAASAHAVGAALGLSGRDMALTGGEDYQLLVSVPPAAWEELARRHGLTAVGRLTVPGGGLVLLRDGHESGWPETGFSHFGEP